MEGADRPFRVPAERAVITAGVPRPLGDDAGPGAGVGMGPGSPVLEECLLAEATWPLLRALWVASPHGHSAGGEWVVWPATGRKMSSALNFTFPELSLMGLTWQMEMWAAVFPRENLAPRS